MNNNNPNLPNMSSVVASWSSTINGWLIKKELKDFVLKETKRFITFKGMVQNYTDTKLDIKEIGQRQWKYYKLHTIYDKLNNDDIIEIQNIRYRILSKSQDKLHYGFVRYTMVEDYIDNKEEKEKENNE